MLQEALETDGVTVVFDQGTYRRISRVAPGLRELSDDSTGRIDRSRTNPGNHATDTAAGGYPRQRA